jgi:acetyl-CoA carboxylase biotin carboxyl carrier protein
MSESPIDKTMIRELADLLKETGLSEIEIEHQGQRIRLVRREAIAAAPAPVSVAMPAPGPAPARAAAELHPGTVTSPMVGTVYVAPEPGAPPFVQLGDMVVEGQTLLIVEAMKTMNPIPAPRAGRISAILIHDAQPVEFGEPLLVIE